MNKFVSHLIALSALTCTAHAASTTFSFLTDTWTNPSSTQTGFESQTAGGANNSSTGFVSKDGITLTFTGSFVGTAVSSGFNGASTEGRSFTNATSTNPPGFTFGTANDSNPITFSATAFSGVVSNYQRWDFSFSNPVLLTDFTLQDIDSNQASGGFRDIIAAEGFLSATPATAGTGIGATYTLFGSPSTSLLTGTATFGGNTLTAVGAPLGLGNPNSTPEVSAQISFGATAISSFSVYAYSDLIFSHRLSLSSSSFEVTTVPETSSALLGSLAVLTLLRRRRSDGRAG